MSETWFDITARANFEKHLAPLNGEALRCLQLGTWKGDASYWLMTHLTDATLIDVDDFRGSDEHKGWDMDKVRDAYKQVMDPYRHRSQLFETDTTYALRELYDADQYFDFIYIDADHHAAAVLSDAVRAWPLLAPQGILCFDDYTWQAPSRRAFDAPWLGIAAFSYAYSDQFRVMDKNSQMWVRKL